MLPPGRARLATTPAPTGSAACTNTIGTLRVSRRRDRGGHGQDGIRRERDQLRRVLAIAVGIACAPARFDAHVAAIGPAQFRERLLEGS